MKNFTPREISIEEIAAKYIEKMKKVQPYGPYYIVGGCIGGNIAFEIVRQLEERKEQVALLALLDSFAPMRSNDDPGFSIDTEKAMIQYLFENTSACNEIGYITDINKLWPRIVDCLEGQEETLAKSKTIIPPEISNIPGFAELYLAGFVYYLNVIRTLMYARALYIPSKKVKAPVYFLEASLDDMIADKDQNIKTWHLHCENTACLIKVNANHFSMYETPHINILADLINKEINSLR